MSPPSLTKKIYLTRHAQAGHNVNENWTIADAELTPLGRKQSAQLHEDTKDGLQKTAELIVSSPVSCGFGSETRTLRCLLAGIAGRDKKLHTDTVLLQLRRPMQTMLDGYISRFGDSCVIR